MREQTSDRTQAEQLAERIVAGLLAGGGWTIGITVNLFCLETFFPGWVGRLLSNQVVDLLLFLLTVALFEVTYGMIMRFIDRRNGTLIDFSNLFNSGDGDKRAMG